MTEPRIRPFRLILLGALFLLLVVGANSWKSSLKVKQVVVEGNRIVDPNEIIQLSQVETGSLLYSADLTAIQRNVMSHHYVKDAIVERALPTTIRITVVERTPIAVINRGGMVYVDEDGVLLPRATSKILVDLPVVSGIPQSVPLTLGSQIDQPDAVEALRILAALHGMSREMYHQISEVQVRPGGDLVLYAAEYGVPVIFGKGEIGDKLVRLETVWDQVIRDRGVQNIEYVDVRYDDQVIIRWLPEANKSNAPSRGI